jgi:ATP-dependent Clp protease ATP-binding subunit ClpC
MDGFNFTERVRKILTRAREEATRLNHSYVGTEHILLGLVAEEEGVAIEVLRGLGADPQALARLVEGAIQPGRDAVNPRVDLPYTSRGKKILELAMQEVRMLKHRYVGSEHLLLGMLAEGKGIAAQVLAEAGVTLEAARSETVRLLEGGAPALKETSVDRIEVIVHHRDGRRVESSFSSVQDAIGFLRSTPPPP